MESLPPKSFLNLFLIVVLGILLIALASIFYKKNDPSLAKAGNIMPNPAAFMLTTQGGAPNFYDQGNSVSSTASLPQDSSNIISSGSQRNIFGSGNNCVPPTGSPWWSGPRYFWAPGCKEKTYWACTFWDVGCELTSGGNGGFRGQPYCTPFSTYDSVTNELLAPSCVRCIIGEPRSSCNGPLSRRRGDPLGDGSGGGNPPTGCNLSNNCGGGTVCNSSNGNCCPSTNPTC